MRAVAAQVVVPEDPAPVRQPGLEAALGGEGDPVEEGGELVGGRGRAA